MATFEHFVVVRPFLIHSTSCNEYLLYCISVHLHKHWAEFLNKSVDDPRFVEIESLELFIHNGSHESIRFKVHAGHGYRLPSINHNASDE